jgi:hypothetical protein
MFRWLRKKIFAAAARMLTKPRGRYSHLLRNDLEGLRKSLRPGDVILIDGDQRVSEVIKYLTQSTWSHAFSTSATRSCASAPPIGTSSWRRTAATPIT